MFFNFSLSNYELFKITILNFISYIKFTKKRIMLNPENTISLTYYDDSYASKKKLSIHESHGMWMTNQYHPKNNPDGFINFGTSVNSAIPKTTSKYFPSFLGVDNSFYNDPRGYDQQLNSKIAEGTLFNWIQTYTFNNLSNILSLFCYQYKSIHIINEPNNLNLDAILDHSFASLQKNPQNVKLIIIFDDQFQKYASHFPNCPKLVILTDKTSIKNKNISFENIAFAYQIKLNPSITLASVQTKDPNVAQKIAAFWLFFALSTIPRKASLLPQLQVKIKDSSTGVIRKMIQIDSNASVDEENLWLSYGGSSCLDHLGRILLQKGSTICIDSPYYAGFDFDLINGGAKISHKNMLTDKRPMIERIKQAQIEGYNGYIICNPNNPLGSILSPTEVDEICSWAKGKQNFHLIFDELYLNTCRKNKTKTAASYANSLPNIHVVRGMAKDFGLCGFKIGILISSNKKVYQKLRLWRPIFQVHPFTISIVNELILGSNYGADIIHQGKKLLIDYFQVIQKKLNEIGIQYIKPEAGCFVFLNLQKFMKSISQEEQDRLWKKLFYKYKLNMFNGANYHVSEPGYFRMCPITDFQIMTEGLRRIKAALEDISDEQNDGKEITLEKN